MTYDVQLQNEADDYYERPDDEVEALWEGRLPMDRVLETLQKEIEGHRVALARAEAAEASREALADRLVFEMEQRETLAARVAELEATLISNSELDNGPWHVLSETVAERNRLADRVAELEAAQQWRPTPAPQEPTP